MATAVNGLYGAIVPESTTRAWFAYAPLGEPQPEPEPTVIPDSPCWWCGELDAPWVYPATERPRWVDRAGVAILSHCSACETCHAKLGDEPRVRLVESMITDMRDMREPWFEACMFVASLSGPPFRR